MAPLGTDEEALAARASALLDADVASVEPLLGGTSSLTYKAALDGHRLVVIKVAQPGLPPTGNRDILRQARVLKALDPIGDVASPSLLGADPGAPPPIPPMLIMEFVSGESYEPLLAERSSPLEPVDMRARVLSAAEMLAAMHNLDPASLDLGAEHPTSLEKEIGRWERAFSTVPDELADGSPECARRLRARLPSRGGQALLHGDWRLGNMLSDGSNVNAVIDWEIWSLGDPLIDVAWFLMMCDPTRPTAPAPPPGMPSIGEIWNSYVAVRDEDREALAWFDALVRYKQAAAAALIVKNRRRRGEDETETRRMRGLIGPLLEQARERLG